MKLANALCVRQQKNQDSCYDGFCRRVMLNRFFFFIANSDSRILALILLSQMISEITDLKASDRQGRSHSDLPLTFAT